MEHSNVDLNTMNYFEAIPNEVQAKIFNYLNTKELIGKLARSSKRVANIVQNSISTVNGPHNSLNIFLTGHNGAGSTTLYSRLQQEISVNSVVRNLAESKEITTTFSLVDDQRTQICSIQLENTRANLWHGSTKDNKAKKMYPHCGAAQCIIYVVSCSEIATRLDNLRNDIICYHALTSDVQWIFVINKMDQVQYNEQEYNKCVDSIKKIAVKVIGEQRTSKLHFIPMTANDMHTRVTCDDNTLHMTWSNKNTMQLWHVMNQIANESCSEPLKLFRKFKASVVRTYGFGPENKDKKEGIAIVYVIEGCVSVGDIIQILPCPFTWPPVSYHFERQARLAPTEVTGIQSFGANKKIALPNSYVSLAIKKIYVERASYADVIQQRFFPTPKHSIIQYPIVNEDNKPKFLDKILWFGRPTYEAVIVHVGYQNGRYKWNGLIHEGFDAAIQSLGIRGSIKITKIKAIYDKNGNSLDLEEVKKERKVLAIKKGEKAEVTLYAYIPLNVTIRDQPLSFNDVNGRFVIQTQNNHVVAAGVMVQMTNFFFSE